MVEEPTPEGICPKCGERCDRDSVDVGVGVIHGPYGCACCGWSESEEYDLSGGRDPLDDKGGAIDQWGGYHPPGSARARGLRWAREMEQEIGLRPARKSEVDQ